MTMRRKVRSDAKLEHLSEAQHTRLVIWLTDENCTYTEAVERVRAEFGVCVGRTAVAAYYQRHVVPLRQDDEVDAVAVIAELRAGVGDEATVRQAKALAWSALCRPMPQLDTATTLLKLVGRVERREIAQRRLELQARRAALREKEAARRAGGRVLKAEVAEAMRTAQWSERVEISEAVAAPETGSGAEAEMRAFEAPRAMVASHIFSRNLPRYSPYSGLGRDRGGAESAGAAVPRRWDFEGVNTRRTAQPFLQETNQGRAEERQEVLVP